VPRCSTKPTSSLRRGTMPASNRRCGSPHPAPSRHPPPETATTEWVSKSGYFFAWDRLGAPKNASIYPPECACKQLNCYALRARELSGPFVGTHLRHGVEGRGRFASAARRGIGRCMRASDNDPGPIPLWHPAQVGARCNVPLLTQAAVETPVRYTQRGSRSTEPLRPLDT